MNFWRFSISWSILQVKLLGNLMSTSGGPFLLSASRSCHIFPTTKASKYLAGGFNPLKNISQIGSSPQVRMKIKNIWNHQPGTHTLTETNQPKAPSIGRFPPRLREAAVCHGKGRVERSPRNSLGPNKCGRAPWSYCRWFRNPANHLAKILVIYRVLYISGG